MSIKTRWFSYLLSMLVFVGLGACSQQGTGTATPAPASGQASAAAALPGGLRITSYGPDNTKAGVAFNVQPGGGAALWIRVDRSLDGGKAAVDFNGTLLPGNVSGQLVTAGVPVSLYAKPGTYSLHVIAQIGTQSVQSNDVKFTVN